MSGNIVAYQGMVFDVGEDVDYIDIMHVGDLHLGDSNCDINAVKGIVDWVMEDTEHRYITIGGDIVNAALANSKSDVYNEAMNVDEAMEFFCDTFSTISDNIIAVIDGNHDRRVMKSVGVDPVKWCCSKLGVPYAHGEAYITLRVGNWDRNRKPDKKRSPICYTVYMNHGNSGGFTPGAAINSVAKKRDVVVADLYLSAHVHKPSVTPMVAQEFDTRTGKILLREQYLAISRAYLKREGYPCEFGAPPVSTHSPIIRLDGHRKKMTATI